MHDPVHHPLPVHSELCRIQLKRMQMTGSFNNKQVIIAGGTSGIGLATAKMFAASQAQVTVTGRNPEKLTDAIQAGIQAVEVNHSDRAAIAAFFKTHGPIDHLVIAVSGSKGAGAFAELSLDTLRAGFDDKFWAHLHTIQEALPYMQQGGSITLVTAISATATMPGTAGLAAINGALEIMVPILSKEIKPVRVNAVSPGVVDTGWWDFLPADAKQETFKQFGQQTAVGRVAQPEEIAQAILFVAGNTYMTGKVIGCDGGLS